MSIEQFVNAFRGRASRMRFWIVLSIILPSLLALLIVFWVYALSIPGAYENGGPTPMPKGPFGIIATVAYFAALAALCVSLLAISIRRLHDRDKAWWWILIFLVIPDAMFGYGRYIVDSSMGAAGTMPFVALIYPGTALWLWGLVELGFLRGTAGTNRFGPDPLASQMAN